MRAPEGGAVSRVGGGEGGAILEGGETYASTCGHADGNALYWRDPSNGQEMEPCGEDFLIGLRLH